MHVCPICDRHFSAHNIESHVNLCLAKSSSSTNAASPPALKSPPMSQAFQTHVLSSSKRPRPSTPQRQEETGADMHTPKRKNRQNDTRPLAERMRPTCLADVLGQDELLGPDKPLRRLLESGNIPNMILWGPPGCGKTTLATLLGKQKKETQRFVALSATTAKLAQVREVFEKAVNEAQLLGRQTILFVDEIHRFSKLQQDTFLPQVESGAITLVGATTENPSFELNGALLSRCRVFVLEKIQPEHIQRLLRRAAGVASSSTSVDDSAIAFLADQCNGDARMALNALEMAMLSARPSAGSQGAPAHSPAVLTLAHVKAGFQRSHALYDRKGDAHYDCISALHKSIRGSDGDAALYWLGRMLQGGENPLYVARRLIRVASEDVGLADSQALPLAVSAFQACHAIGMPECDVILAHCVVYLARAPKSVEVYKAYKRVKQTIDEWSGVDPDVPVHLRNAPTRLMENLGYGKEYKYNPDYEGAVDQTYLPDQLVGHRFLQPHEWIHRAEGRPSDA